MVQDNLNKFNILIKNQKTVFYKNSKLIRKRGILKMKENIKMKLKHIFKYNEYSNELKKLKERGEITEKELKKKLLKVGYDSIIFLLIIIIGPVIIFFSGYEVVTNINNKRIEAIEKSKEVTMPNVIGKTMAEAEEELLALELNVDKCSSNYKDLNGKNSDSIVQRITKDYSSIKEGDIVKKGDTIQIWGMSESWKEEQEERKEKGYKYCPANTSTIINCAKTLISNQLKAPSTAVWGKTEKVDEDNYGRCLVYISVESQNSFGGMVKSDFLVVLQEVNTDGKFTYLPYTSVYTIKTSLQSAYSYVEAYKNGTTYAEVETFLENNKWNVRPTEE